MTFAEQRATDLAATAFNTEEFAVMASYHDGNSAKEIPVRMLYSDGKTDRNSSSAVVRVRKSDVSSPEYRHTVTVNGLGWTVDRQRGGKGFDEDELTWFLPVIRNQKVGPCRR